MKTEIKWEQGARRRGGFTLVELMVVIGIIAVIMTIAIPSVYRSLHQDSMRKAVNDVMEACANARARAILDGVTMELRIRPGDRVFSIMTGPVSAKPAGNAFAFGDGEEVVERPVSSATGFSVTLSDRVIIEGLGVNGEDWTQDEEAAVRFYPNGTSDELSIVLFTPNTNERRNITLEVVTGIADVESDLSKFKDR